jgi:outer membrane biosynthesis protein TonB
MIKLDSLTAAFVHQVLEALRAATLDELTQLVTPPAPRARHAVTPRPAPAPPPKFARVAPLARARAAKPQPAKAPPPKAQRPKSQPAKPPPPKKKPQPAAPLRVVVAEITDPERLLAATTPSAPRHVAPAAVARDEEPPPASGERATLAASSRLRAGETLVRASGTGVVIRRAKRG